MNTSVMITSAFYSTNVGQNTHLLKYNKKLDGFLCRFNRLVDDRIEYIINDTVSPELHYYATC